MSRARPSSQSKRLMVRQPTAVGVLPLTYTASFPMPPTVKSLHPGARSTVLMGAGTRARCRDAASVPASTPTRGRTRRGGLSRAFTAVARPAPNRSLVQTCLMSDMSVEDIDGITCSECGNAVTLTESQTRLVNGKTTMILTGACSEGHHAEVEVTQL